MGKAAGVVANDRSCEAVEPERPGAPAAVPAPAEVLLRVSELAIGESGVIERVEAPEPVAGRLLDLGLTPGTTLLVLRAAPLGDPLVLELRGYQLCLRRSEAAGVRVRIERPPVRP